MIKVIRSWRIAEAEPSGLLLWFDPATETVILRDLDPGEKSLYLDSVVSVSAVERERDQIELLDGCEGSSESSDDLPF